MIPTQQTDTNLERACRPRNKKTHSDAGVWIFNEQEIEAKNSLKFKLQDQLPQIWVLYSWLLKFTSVTATTMQYMNKRKKAK